MIGKTLTPVLATAGIGLWQIALALISGLAAKEVVVSSISVLFGIGNASSSAGMAELSAILAGLGFSALNAYALMVFVLLYTPCVATIAVIRRELKSVKWTVATVLYQLFIAWGGVDWALYPFFSVSPHARQSFFAWLLFVF